MFRISSPKKRLTPQETGRQPLQHSFTQKKKMNEEKGKRQDKQVRVLIYKHEKEHLPISEKVQLPFKDCHVLLN